jgi:hypothetical protein
MSNEEELFCPYCGWAKGNGHEDCPWCGAERNEVAHPEHYTTGKIEVIDFIVDQKLDYALGNAIKYICRCNHKGHKVLDLQKAIQYLKFEIEKFCGPEDWR